MFHIVAGSRRRNRCRSDQSEAEEESRAAGDRSGSAGERLKHLSLPDETLYCELPTLPVRSLPDSDFSDQRTRIVVPCPGVLSTSRRVPSARARSAIRRARAARTRSAASRALLRELGSQHLARRLPVVTDH